MIVFYAMLLKFVAVCGSVECRKSLSIPWLMAQKAAKPVASLVLLVRFFMHVHECFVYVSVAILLLL